MLIVKMNAIFANDKGERIFADNKVIKVSVFLLTFFVFNVFLVEFLALRGIDFFGRALFLLIAR